MVAVKYGHPELVQHLTRFRRERIFCGRKFMELVSEEMLQECCQRLGQQIVTDLNGEDVVVVSVPTGAMIFHSDLVRAIGMPYTLDQIGTSSYGDTTVSTGVVRITSDLTKPVHGRTVLIVEDIVDTGLTMKFLFSHVHAHRPKAIVACSLFHKPARLKARDLHLEYVGFEVPDHFLVGYGLDDKQRFRAMSFVGVPVETLTKAT